MGLSRRQFTKTGLPGFRGHRGHRAAITERTRAILAVDRCGQPPIPDTARVIEDAAQVQGPRLKTRSPTLAP